MAALPQGAAATRPAGTSLSLDIEKVSHAYPLRDGHLPVLDDVTLHLEAGSFTALIGPSGCGKSTLLRLASRLDRPTDGTLTVGTSTCGYVFQDPSLLEWRTAARNVELVGELRGVPREERRRRAREALARVGLEAFADQHPRQLSGGMRMRVSLARALVAEPRLALFDEPFGALDEITRLQMQTELQRLFHTGDFAGLFITHSVSEAVYLAGRVLVMSGRPGRIVDEIAVPFAHPRPPELRHTAEFAELTGRVSASLSAGHDALREDSGREDAA